MSVHRSNKMSIEVYKNIGGKSKMSLKISGKIREFFPDMVLATL